MSEAPIDVWSEETFGHQLAERLADHARLIVDYFTESRRLWKNAKRRRCAGPCRLIHSARPIALCLTS